MNAQTVWLAVMAVSLFIMAAMQVGIALIVLKLGQQVARTTEEFRRDVKPLIEKANRIADDASRATALAVMQVERIDQMLATTAERVEETLGVIQSAIITPVRQGAALVTAFKAAFSVFRDARDRRERARQTRDDEEALFVG